ncbi:unnamed protein product [Linum trigynum]|uniref:Uncharacterized protein n=1 Tax=Linum trigynum TaxID=586398 RepID=A0AAV2EY91_9ROSI
MAPGAERIWCGRVDGHRASGRLTPGEDAGRNHLLRGAGDEEQDKGKKPFAAAAIRKPAAESQITNDCARNNGARKRKPLAERSNGDQTIT